MYNGFWQRQLQLQLQPSYWKSDYKPNKWSPFTFFSLCVVFVVVIIVVCQTKKKQQQQQIFAYRIDAAFVWSDTKNQDVEFLGWALRNALHFGRAVMNGQMQIITALQTLYYNNQLIPFLCISCDQSLVQFGLDATFVGNLKLLCVYIAYCNSKMSFIACIIFSCRERENEKNIYSKS